MRIFLFACCAMLGLVSCSLPPSVMSPHRSDQDLRAGQLLNIRIERWDKLRFSGLLGVREIPGKLDYVLLDATGIKLLQAEVAGDGSFTLLQESGPLQKSGLPPFLSEALARIYLQEPDRLPCTGSWLYRLCREDEDGSSVKFGQAGPFTVWRVRGRDPIVPEGPKEAGEAAVVYHQPWLGVKVKLERLGAGK